MRIQKPMQNLVDLFLLPYVACFPLFERFSSWYLVCVRLCAHIYGDEENCENENRLKILNRSLIFFSSK